LPTNPNNTLILQVLVTTVNRDRQVPASPGRRRAADEALVCNAEDQKGEVGNPWCRHTFHPIAIRKPASRLMESLVSLALMLVVTGAAFSLINPNTATSQTQPEVMDMQQRARIGADMLSRDLIMAGAGVYSGPQTGALMNFFAPIIPRRMGRQGADAYTVVRSDAVTISYIPNTYSQTTIRQDMPQPSLRS
jgi:hypothetical protein